jgi:hypothetical protein
MFEELLVLDRGYHLATRGKLSLDSHPASVDGQLSRTIKSLLPTPQFVATAQLVADQFVHSTLGEHSPNTFCVPS